MYFKEKKFKLIINNFINKNIKHYDYVYLTADLRGFLNDNWQASHSKKTGNPVYERPSVLIIYREDHKFLLSDIIPKQDIKKADFV